MDKTIIIICCIMWFLCGMIVCKIHSPNVRMVTVVEHKTHTFVCSGVRDVGTLKDDKRTEHVVDGIYYYNGGE